MKLSTKILLLRFKRQRLSLKEKTHDNYLRQMGPERFGRWMRGFVKKLIKDYNK